MSLSRTWLASLLLGGIWLQGVASAQFPFGGPPGGGGQQRMAEMMERVVTGTVQDVNPIKGYIQVGSSRRSRIVIAGPNTEITRLAEVPFSELAVGDRISVTGVPVAIRADSLLLSQPLSLADVLQALQESEAPADTEAETPRTDRPGGAPAGGDDADGGEAPATPPEPGDETAEEPMPPTPMPTAGAPASMPSTTMAGTVKSLEPFLVELEDGQQISVVLSDTTSVLRRAEADMSAVVVDQQILALGDVDQDGYLAASRIYLGESVAMGRMPGGRGGFGFGPPGDFRGGPRGRGPGEPRTPFEEE